MGFPPCPRVSGGLSERVALTWEELIHVGRHLPRIATVSRAQAVGIRAQAGQGGNRVAVRRGGYPRYFQISAPVQPGNSGGALVDERGNVIGIVSAKLDAGAALAASGALPENVNYAVKSSLVLSFLESVPDGFG